ncbi:hypothetical protein EDD85DRAFT_785266 [Armillaria nabsnona]|nr:hypothetical protein EDD85DRAFT_785266 [Armillaria nabsnona]
MKRGREENACQSPWETDILATLGPWIYRKPGPRQALKFDLQIMKRARDWVAVSLLWLDNVELHPSLPFSPTFLERMLPLVYPNVKPNGVCIVLYPRPRPGCQHILHKPALDWKDLGGGGLVCLYMGVLTMLELEGERFDGAIPGRFLTTVRYGVTVKHRPSSTFSWRTVLARNGFFRRRRTCSSFGNHVADDVVFRSLMDIRNFILRVLLPIKTMISKAQMSASGFEQQAPV